MTYWPYPKFVAHRGAGKFAPENTLAAARLGTEYGYKMFECDVKLSADGVPFLLHDDTLDRTSNGKGVAGLQTWDALSKLDAGSWHSRAYAGETIATLEAMARFCIANKVAINIELKPTEDDKKLSHRTGQVIAKLADELWAKETLKPFLSSFDVDALKGAQKAAPDLMRGLLLETLWDGWLEAAVAMGCSAVVCDQTLWTVQNVKTVKAKKMRCWSYTVNEVASAEKLFSLGTDGIITDRVDLFAPD